MSHIELVIPFILPPAELATDLLRDMKLPALSMLLARSVLAQQVAEAREHDRFARALPHETWLARHFGLVRSEGADNSPPVATALMRALGLVPSPGYWFIVQPVHYHIARDHLVLTDLRHLHLTEQDSRALFATAQRSFEDAGLTLCYGCPDYWFVRADRHDDLQTATPDATCGRNIDIWMPQGESARSWRKLQNEVQMDWHTDVVNETRAAAGQTPVNSLWLWGGAVATATVVEKAPEPAGDQRAMFNFNDWFAAFGAPTDARETVQNASAVLAHTVPDRRVLLNAMIGPALAGDWAVWLEEMQRLETHWFGPLLAALQAGAITSLSLVTSHGTRLDEWHASRAGLRKFWRKASLERLRS